MLVVGAKWDPATRYQGAVIAHDLLPNSALLTVNSWGHTSLFTSACADAAIAAYLISTTTPPPGTVCSRTWCRGSTSAPAARKRPPSQRAARRLTVPP